MLFCVIETCEETREELPIHLVSLLLLTRPFPSPRMPQPSRVIFFLLRLISSSFEPSPSQVELGATFKVSLPFIDLKVSLLRVVKASVEK